MLKNMCWVPGSIDNLSFYANLDNVHLLCMPAFPLHGNLCVLRDEKILDCLLSALCFVVKTSLVGTRGLTL